MYEPGAALLGTLTVNLTSTSRPRRTVVRPGSLIAHPPAAGATGIARLPSEGWPGSNRKLTVALGAAGAEWSTKVCV